MKYFLFYILILLIPIFSYSQTDSLLLKNDDIIVGEIKSMNKGVLIIKTSYSDTDFNISWDGIKRITSNTNYLITTSDGNRINGTLRSLSDSTIGIKTQYLKKNNELVDQEEIILEVLKSEIVYLNSLDEGFFWGRLKLEIDIGFNLTGANNLRQYTLNTVVGYQADRWDLRTFYKDLSSFQGEISRIKRSEFGANYHYFLPKDWYLLYHLNLLSNTEQLIDLRTSNLIGFGKYVIRSNKQNLGIFTGGNLNIEKFSNQESSSSSGEALLGAIYEIFDIGDLDLFTSVLAFPSLTERERFRTDFKFDIRYKFNFDLYFKIGTTINYDNRPTEGAQKADFIFQTTIGWSL